MPHTRAPGAGYAMVVNAEGFGPSPSATGSPFYLSGEGALACAWLAVFARQAELMRTSLTVDDVGTYIRLPVDQLAVMLQADISRLLPRDGNDRP